MAIEYAPCWWCGEPCPKPELLHLEGARLVGSDPLSLPVSMTLAERASVRVCPRDAKAFAILRWRHDAEARSADPDAPIMPGSVLEHLAASMGPEELDRIERLHGKTVADRLRRIVERRRREAS